MEMVEMYCDLLLARFGLLTQMKNLDEGLAESVSSILWAAPRLQAEVQELKIISDILTYKFGKQYADACRSDNIGTINQKLQHKMSVQSPPRLLIEKYLIEIAKNFNVDYDPDPEVMKEDQGIDALLNINDSNNLGGNTSSGGGMPQPPGFIGFPQPPLLPNVPFNYPNFNNQGGGGGSTGGFVMPPSAPLSYNIPPGAEVKDLNTNFMLDDVDDLPPPPYNQVSSPDENKPTNINVGKTKPQIPASKLSYPDIPDLPNVPSDDVLPTAHKKEDEIDFDDLARRFEELKKRK